MNLSVPAIITLAVALVSGGGLLTVLITAWIGRNGRRADVASTIEETAGKWLDRADKRVDKCIEENKSLRGIVVDLLLVIEEAASSEADPARAQEWRARAMRARMAMQD